MDVVVRSIIESLDVVLVRQITGELSLLTDTGELSLLTGKDPCEKLTSVVVLNQQKISIANVH